MDFSSTKDRRQTSKRHVPFRTCVGCRQIADQGTLLRAWADPSGHLSFDLGPRRFGRGVYVHRQEGCMKAALKVGFARSLRRMVLVGDVAACYQLAAVLDSPSPGPAPALSLNNQDNHP
ncbi:MAG TPA: YlxR family protein [Pseudomonadota bacterium]|jgi:predicted RNA-binding protein YlxR (DUF448 family)|nr:YlxR family protein [Pseudomonadota bacterium]